MLLTFASLGLVFGVENVTERIDKKFPPDGACGDWCAPRGDTGRYWGSRVIVDGGELRGGGGGGLDDASALLSSHAETREASSKDVIIGTRNPLACS